MMGHSDMLQCVRAQMWVLCSNICLCGVTWTTRRTNTMCFSCRTASKLNTLQSKRKDEGSKEACGSENPDWF
uniref:Secreted protein n=1 Tax=Knipowitschia caucasica TaxID=637954 RepID=A0AAV2KGR5_KNICA